MILPSATHGRHSNPRGNKKDLRVEPLDIALHVEHKIPNQTTNPAGSDCKIAIIAVLSLKAVKGSLRCIQVAQQANRVFTKGRKSTGAQYVKRRSLPLRISICLEVFNVNACGTKARVANSTCCSPRPRKEFHPLICLGRRMFYRQVVLNRPTQYETEFNKVKILNLKANSPKAMAGCTCHSSMFHMQRRVKKTNACRNTSLVVRLGSVMRG